MITLNTQIKTLSRVGQATSTLLNRLGINTVEELLYYFPFRYDDFSLNSKINGLVPGSQPAFQEK
jgi:ATP-dependent DNA helicase RecG